MNTLRDLYVDELKDLWSAEKQLIKALPKMAKAANDPELSKAFMTHLRETERQVERLEQVFEELGESPRGKKCIGMEGLIEEGQELLKEKPDPDVLDAGLIAKAQHIEHYEIAGYGTVRTYAQLLGAERQAQLLQQTLDEEGKTDKLLTQLAESSINVEAATAEGEEEEEETTRGARGRSEREISRRTAVEGGRGGARGGRGRSGGRAKETESTAR
ncbi:MAG TPA: ferritin-like domain-containing protein [Gemmatimonadaceae bacterium]|nr:ferritin-like domain-containing protein [Gemmatimonadaceae bacterium]